MSFEEQFPSLNLKMEGAFFIDKYNDMAPSDSETMINLMEHCLDKQKVREVLLRWKIGVHGQSAREGDIARRVNNRINNILEELGLGDEIK